MTSVRSIATMTHGRYISVEPEGGGDSAAALVGFHGYAEDAEIQLERLRGIPGSNRWRVLSIQGLHRFYQRRTNQVVAGWMTRQDREVAIADNIAYVKACMEAECPRARHAVFAGFSQGVAMAYRAAVHAARSASVIAVGGDVPPELDTAALRMIRAVLIARGASDEWYKEAQFADDQRRLRDASVRMHAITLNTGHEWPPDLAASTEEFLRDRLADLAI